jgi:lipopolysaccharide transport system permease protein
MSEADHKDIAHEASTKKIVLYAGAIDRLYYLDLWKYRDLLALLAWRDIAVQYKQTAFGTAWAVVRPLITVAVFTFIFGRIARLPSQGVAPYPIMVMAAMLPWFLFATILTQGSNSLIQNTNLISKVYFPRLIVPVAASAVALVDFAITIVLLLGLMALYRFAPDWRIMTIPFFTLLCVTCALGPALMFAGLNVRYRDFRFIVPFVVQFGLYVSPVGFSSDIVPSALRLIYSANPMVGVIDGFRWSLLGAQAKMYWEGFWVGLIVNMIFLWLGLRTFRATEKSFADVI